MTEKAKQPTTFHYILFSIIICISLIFSTDLFAETSISGIIAQDTTWTVDGSPYIVTGSVTVQGTDGTDGITSLTIEPGVEVRFNRYMMMTIGGTSGAPGALSAQGSTDNKIYFTSNQASPAPGDWYYIKFNTTTDDATTILDNCVVEYAGVSQGAINIYSASPTIQNSLIKNNKNAGVYIAYGSAILTNNTISDNTTYGVNMTGSSSEISNTSFNNNGNYDIYSGGVFTGKVNNNEIRNGLYTGSGAFPDLSGNTIQYNNAYPLRMGADSVGALMADNTITGTDAQSFMEVTTDTIEKDATWTSILKYHILGNLIVQGTDGTDGITTLTIEPDVEVRFNRYIMMTIGGTSGAPGALSAQGSTDNKIYFTSNQASPAPGDWYYIKFNTTTDDATTILDNCVVEYAGVSQGAINIYSASPTIKNSLIHNNKNAGVYIAYGSAILTNNTISDNTTYGVNMTGSSSEISNTSFNNNGNYDIYSAGVFTGKVNNNEIRNGLYTGSGAFPDLSGNTIQYNNAYPLRMGADSVGALMADNTITGTDAQSFMEVTADTIEKDATWTSILKYHILGNLIVQGTDGTDGITTLTIEPDVEVRFNRYIMMTIGGTSGAPGALSAQGSTDNKIYFTSNQASPAPGDWYYIKFNTTTDDATTILDNCVVEYAGVSQGAINIYSASPTIKNSLILKSKNAGIYASGTGCSDTTIVCNWLTNNKYGVHWAVSPAPEINNNNFSDNTTYGIYYTGSVLLNATNNWWNNPQGPNTGGDNTSGNIDADPWLVQEKQCSQDTVNLPPNVPSTPLPENSSVRVQTNSLTLSWSGGDPNPLDSVVYDINSGTLPESLQLLVADIEMNTFQPSSFLPGKTYYWQVTARDNNGLETLGPVWHFTTNGDPPDLIISSVTIKPAGNIQPDQEVTLISQIQNVGNGPVVDAFEIDFKIDGVSIGTIPINTIVLAGQTNPVSQNWIFPGGDPTIDIKADSLLQVQESNDDNNRFISIFSELADNKAPVMIESLPADNEKLQQLEQIIVILEDSRSEVDDAAVIASFSVKNDIQQIVPGVVTESNDTFLFVPSTLPLSDGTYLVNLQAVDSYGNTNEYSFSFTIDTHPPAKPVITGGIVTSGTIEPRPTQNTNDEYTIVLTGTRENGTSVWINSIERAPLGDGPWSCQLTLIPGINTFEVWLKDQVNNRGESEWVDIIMNGAKGMSFQYDASGKLIKIIRSE